MTLKEDSQGDIIGYYLNSTVGTMRTYGPAAHSALHLGYRNSKHYCRQTSPMLLQLLTGTRQRLGMVSITEHRN